LLPEAKAGDVVDGGGGIIIILLVVDGMDESFILSSNRQEAIKLNPRNNSWAFADGGTPGESRTETSLCEIINYH